MEILDDARSQWTIVGPAGADIDLVSEITEDIPGERIAWRSSEGSDVDHEGWVEFKDNAFGRGTEVRIFISYDPPAGAVGKVVAKVLQREPRIQARRELRRFKQLMETGEISTSKAPEAAPSRQPPFLISAAADTPSNSEISMRALTWHGKHNVQVDTVPDPQIVNPRDAIIKITATAIWRLGPAPLRQHDSGHVERRHPGPRVHGDRRRGRAGQHDAETRRPGRGPLRHRLRKMLLLRPPHAGRLRQLQPRRQG